MATALEALKAQVEANVTVTQSAVALIQGLSAQLREKADDPEAIQELADELEMSTAGLATAVSANTPATDAASDAPTPAPTEGVPVASEPVVAEPEPAPAAGSAEQPTT